MMAAFSEYLKYDALGIGKLVSGKEVAPREVIEEAINLIEKYNPLINAVIYKNYEAALDAAENVLPDGPFSGVPLLLKDLLAACSEVPLTMGCKAYSNYVPDHDSELVRRFKKAGTVILGKTNTPEFGLLGITEPDLHGPTRNPWNTEHTPGGSSGGSAAAVAAGMVPMASGGDGGGSLRIPAAYCGLFGLKPTRGRVPTGPDYGEKWQGAVVEHVVSRSVRDSAAMLDAVKGGDIGAPYVIPEPPRAYLEEVSVDPRPLKIAFTKNSPLGGLVDPECAAAVDETVRLLENLGHHVEEKAPEIDGKAVARAYFMMYYGEVAADLTELKAKKGSKVGTADVESVTMMLGLLGKAYSAGDFALSKREWNRFARVMGHFHQTYDLYLTPTTAALPAKIGELQPKGAEAAVLNIVNSLGLGGLLKASGLADKLALDSLARTPFTQFVNFTGQPAMSVPLYWSKEGLPCGSHFVGAFGNESLLFQLAGQLEKARPWFDRRPSL
jgi:amidase